MGSKKKSPRQAGKMKRDRAKLRGPKEPTYAITITNPISPAEKVARHIDKVLAELNVDTPPLFATQIAVDEYAHVNGVSYRVAWQHFNQQGYNMAHVANEDTEIDDVIDKTPDVYPSDFTPDPAVVEQIETLIANATIEADDNQLAGTEVQPRWESSDWDYGVPAVHDNLTGLYAICEDVMEIDEVLRDLIVDHVPVEAFSWRHKLTDAEVHISHDRELDQFWLLIHEDAGLAALNRVTQQVFPISDDYGVSAAIGMVDAFNRLATEEAQGFDWIEPVAWITPPPEDVPAPAAAAQLTDERKPLRVLVVSSREWAHTGVVVQLIQDLWNKAGNPPLTILTSGMPYGAEGVASGLAATELHDGSKPIIHEVIRDEAIATADIDYAFAFIVNYSLVASQVLDAINLAGIPVHVMTETSAKPKDPWAER